MSTLANLGRRVKEVRGDRGIREAAKEIGISHATLSRIERGFLPDLENYEKVCKWLGVGLAAATGPMKKASASAVEVHFRKEKTSSPETAAALAQLILAVDAALASESREGK